ncbi:hypothetical protein F5Y08DRAFT_349978 [Xylaria arbuscula]|nr:hypothetical protein F5Y08DRAFT_349978 [Xylaria arbuscula]
MNLFDLPPELTQLVFDSIVTTRSLARTMRVRISANTPLHHEDQFKAEIDYAIFRLRLLDPFGFYLGKSNSQMFLTLHREPSFLSYFSSYLTYQTLREQSATSYLGRIRRVADTLCNIDGNLTDHGVFTYIESLIPLAIPSQFNLHCGDHFPIPVTYSEEEHDHDVLVAAIYLGKQSYVQSRMRTGIWNVYSQVFGKAAVAASKQENYTILKLLFPDVSTMTSPVEYLSSVISNLEHAGKYGNEESLDCALGVEAIEGLALEISCEFHGFARVVLQSTKLPRVYERILSYLRCESWIFDLDSKTLLLGPRDNPFYGNVEMTHYYFTRGLRPIFSTDHVGYYRLIMNAIRFHHATLLEMVLEVGGIPNPRGIRLRKFCSPPLMYAIRKGDISVVKVLLNYGVDINEGRPPPIVYAILKERVDLFQLLRSYGATLGTPESGGWAMAIARINGLSSMVDLLVREGVEEDCVLNWAPQPRIYSMSWCYHNLWEGKNPG